MAKDNGRLDKAAKKKKKQQQQQAKKGAASGMIDDEAEEASSSEDEEDEEAEDGGDDDDEDGAAVERKGWSVSEVLAEMRTPLNTTRTTLDILQYTTNYQKNLYVHYEQP